jgi:hypothetical protein
MDEITFMILQVIESSVEPLSTKEIVERTRTPRHLVAYRLFILANEGKIKGKQSKKRGPWIWFRRNR